MAFTESEPIHNDLRENSKLTASSGLRVCQRQPALCHEYGLLLLHHKKSTIQVSRRYTSSEQCTSVPRDRMMLWRRYALATRAHAVLQVADAVSGERHATQDGET